MPKQVIPLSDAKIRTTAPKDKDQALFDGNGLFLLVKPSGRRLWRFKYRFHGRNKMIAMGPYPEISLKEARGRRESARRLLATGVDPSIDRREQRIALAEQKAVATFEQVFVEWMGIQGSKLSPRTTEKIRASMTIHALPKIGALPIEGIQVDALLDLLRAIEAKGALEMARRVRAWVSRVFRYAIITGKCSRDPAADLRGALRVPIVKHHAALAASDLPAFLRALDDPLARIAPLTRLALKLLVLTATRPGELRAAEWKEFNVEKSEWRIPSSRMKMSEEHIVPLAPQVITVLEQIERFSGGQKFLFPAQGNPSRTLSENTLGKAAKTLGFPVTAHGFRSTFSTYSNESERWSVDAIEAQLAHKSTDAVRSAYYRGNRRMDERRRMMRWWAQELDVLQAKNKIIHLSRGR